MAKEVEVDVWERATLLVMVESLSGQLSIPTLSRALKLQEILELNEAEMEEVGWQEVGPRAYRWSRIAEDTTVVLPFPQRLWKLLKGTAQNYQGWPLDDRVLLLLDKLGIELPDDED